MTPSRATQRGSTLVLALSVVVLLTLLGLTVMQSVTVDVETAGAEAGIQWGLQEVQFGYDIGNDPANPDWTEVLANNPVVAPDGVCDIGCPIAGWLQLHEGELTRPYGEGWYRVVVQAGPPGAKSIYLRSYAEAAGGARRLLEVEITPAP